MNYLKGLSYRDEDPNLQTNYPQPLPDCDIRIVSDSDEDYDE